MAADALLAAGQQVRGIDPLIQFDLAALKYGPDRHAKGFLASAAF